MQDIISFLVAKNKISKDEAEEFVGLLFNLVERGLVDDGLSEIEGFGTFKRCLKDELDGDDRRSDEGLEHHGQHSISFSPDEQLRNLVNKPFSHFEVTVLNEGVFIDGIPHEDSSNTKDKKDVKDKKTKSIDEKHEPKQADRKPIDNSNLIIKAAKNAKKEKDKLCRAPLVNSTDTEEDSKISADVKESEEKELLTNKDSLIKQPETSSLSNSKSKNNLKPLWYALGSILVILLLFSANYIYKNHLIDKSSELTSKIDESDKRVNKITDAADNDNTHIESDEAVAVIDTAQTVNPTPRNTVKMSQGRTLRLIALNKLGSKEFWVYIYLINKDKIDNPNVVPVGLVLELPYESEYPMDADNPEDIAKAKQLGNEVMKSLGK